MFLLARSLARSLASLPAPPPPPPTPPKLPTFLQNHFNISQTLGGGIASISGLLNLVSRPSGGVVSDLVSARFGHRARITWLFVAAFGGGLFMLLFGALPISLAVGTVLMIIFSFLYEQGARECTVLEVS